MILFGVVIHVSTVLATPIKKRSGMFQDKNIDTRTGAVQGQIQFGYKVIFFKKSIDDRVSISSWINLYTDTKKKTELKKNTAFREIRIYSSA